ncbi:MAG: ribonuclease III [Bdellovibrionales bacterium]|nr:ribonuclease III [Bdellovibrionales bacterium]
MKKYTQKELIQLSGVELFKQAFTHKSFLESKENNETLEFLGDALLNFLVAELLFKKYPKGTEGDFTKKRSQLLKGSTLSKIAQDLEFYKYLRVQDKKDQKNPRLLEDALEAYTATLYLKGGIEFTRKWVQDLFEDYLEISDDNYKSFLQEWCQKNYQEIPSYVIKKKAGLEHSKTFYVEVFIKKKACGFGVGSSKKKAQQLAAKKALETLKIWKKL